MEWLRERKDGISIEIKVQPQSSKNEWVREPHWLKVKLTTPAVEGRANQALIGFLSERLEINKRSVQIIRGERSQRKTILLRDLSKIGLISALERGKKSG